MTQAAGTVKWFNSDRDFGFVIPDEGGADLLVEGSDFLAQDGDGEIREGQLVNFDIRVGSKGPQALRVSPRSETPDQSAGMRQR
ncbi:cold-shock protein [Nocardia goodfellowii]|uniref:CspA family cold shock protein n=1 Tax=Nocardia goodfellowii TaxID=882446 RepID=A0ABS4QJ92_9NOCA|nr:cold shock domain-containing protein [Nocardia goodfellowii]MBP2191180.1 CspA family cold shock protein [Nocardia goodfellowii]